MLNLDVYQLFTVLLTTAILQEFAIKPSVELIKKYVKKGRKHLEKIK
jgi:hypothetical protein